jgi:hypothetical protein
MRRKKKEELDQKVKDTLKMAADKIREDRQRMLYVADTHVNRTRKLLEATFTEEQKELYRDYMEAEQRYIDLYMAICKNEV